jgi:hypothetical protein
LGCRYLTDKKDGAECWDHKRAGVKKRLEIHLSKCEMVQHVDVDLNMVNELTVWEKTAALDVNIANEFTVPEETATAQHQLVDKITMWEDQDTMALTVLECALPHWQPWGWRTPFMIYEEAV